MRMMLAMGILLVAATAAAQDVTPLTATPVAPVALATPVAPATPAASPAPVRLGLAPVVAPEVEPVVLPFELVINRPLVRVSINGQGPFPMLLGPEAQESRIDPELVELLKLTLPKPDQPPLTVDVTFSPSYSIKVTPLIQDLSQETPDIPLKLRPRGVISLSVWRGQLVTLDYSRWKLSIEPGSLPEANRKDIFELNAAGELRLPLSTGGAAVDCHVDPWFPAALMLPATTLGEGQVVGTIRDQGMIRTKEAILPVREGRLATEVVLGPFEVKTALVLLSDHTDVATVGTPWLARYAVTYDLANGRIRLERPNKEQTRSRN
jgi:hypothetical protein